MQQSQKFNHNNIEMFDSENQRQISSLNQNSKNFFRQKFEIS